MIKQIPNLFTLLNLVFGCLAIICILQTGETFMIMQEGQWIAQLPEKIWWGSICIFIAAAIDFLDGFVARLFKATSPLGAQLDSLADVVSFGVAPGLIMYQLLRISFIGEESGLDTYVLYLMPALLIPCAGAYRLARFNIDPQQSEGFKGVPIPAVGLIVASLPIILLYNYFGLTPLILNKWVLYSLIVLLSYLMVSTLPLMALKFKNFSFKDNAAKFILLATGIVAAILLKWLAIPVVFVLYIVLSLSFKTKR
ncbi:CDP-alcohol phosphatidyltransferase family protein [Gynurincola endophyticus]|uniref:CDP-alcohol phosphatidyltransferase family protein n=1 Tax=Gynurincola endophyticus TaxID=2479004 RepID=UPI001F27C204|nr:CDP-alcohol phosphatidyltransferase family protein [Gynurincola endophyticus]